MVGSSTPLSPTHVSLLLPPLSNLPTQHHHTDANYLLKSLQGFQSKGIPIWAISLQVRAPIRSPPMIIF